MEASNHHQMEKAGKKMESEFSLQFQLGMGLSQKPKKTITEKNVTILTSTSYQKRRTKDSLLFNQREDITVNDNGNLKYYLSH